MNLEKFYGVSVNDARNKAHKQLGSNFIVIETKEALNDTLAWVHVLNENPTGNTKNELGTYSRSDLFPKVLTKLKETLNQNFPLFDLKKRGKTHAPFLERDGRPLASPTGGSSKSSAHSVSKPNSSGENNDTSKMDSLEKEIRGLSNRFDRLEQLVSGQVVGTRYISHPAFQQLWASGVPRATIISWFNELLNSGSDPFDQEGNFGQQLAERIRRTIDIAESQKPPSILFFTGAAGAGKSNLIMKLVLHPKLLEQTNCTLVSVCPPEIKYHYSPLRPFASDHDLPYHTIRDKHDFASLAGYNLNFDHLLVEMPSDSKRENATVPGIENFKSLLPANCSVEVHRLINATQNQPFRSSFDSAVDPSAATHLAFTHLDKTPREGNLLAVMEKAKCKVRYVSAGPKIPDDISLFDAARFARQLLAHS